MLLKKIAYTIATGFGSGYSPLIPGTAGSFIALIIFVLVPLDNASWLIMFGLRKL